MRGSLTKLAVVAQTGNIFAKVFTETERVSCFSRDYISTLFAQKKLPTVFARFFTWFLGWNWSRGQQLRPDPHPPHGNPRPYSHLPPRSHCIKGTGGWEWKTGSLQSYTGVSAVFVIQLHGGGICSSKIARLIHTCHCLCLLPLLQQGCWKAETSPACCCCCCWGAWWRCWPCGRSCCCW